MIFCRDRSSSLENGCWTSNSSPNLGFVRQSGSGPLCITGVIPMPTLVLPEFPVTSGHKCACSPLAAKARAPITSKLYSSKWRVFESWCLAHAVDPVTCLISPVLEFLQERHEARVAATTLRVYVTAIAARRELDEIPLGRCQKISAFMGGVRHLRPVRPIGSSFLGLVSSPSLWRQSPQLLVRFGAGRRGLATSKHRISHWVRNSLRWLMRCVVFLHLSVFGRILLGAWLPLKLFSEGFP